MFKLFILILILLTGPSSGFSQTQKYVNTEDQIATFQKIQFWGIRDNTDGVFAKPIYEQTLETLNKQKQFTVINQSIPTSTPYLQKESERKKILGDTDGAIWGEILKQGTIFKIRFHLFDRNGVLFLNADKTLEPDLSLRSLTKETHNLIAELIGNLPYQGWVVGKKGRLVTLNYGSSQGAKVGDELDVILITNIKRHPVEYFATEFEKILIGKIVIQKTDLDLSFGSITQERSPGIIQVGSKFEAPKTVTYPMLVKTQDGQLIEPKLPDSQEKLVIGKVPSEWSQTSPQFGFFGFQLGLSQNVLNQNLLSSNTIEGQASPLPSLSLNGELWVTANLSLDLTFQQSIGTLSLSGSGSTSKLNYSDSTIRMGTHYRFNFDFDSSQSYFFLGGRFYEFLNSVQETSNHDLTSHKYSGLAATLGMRYAFPERKVALVTQMEIPVLTSSSESPVTSGNPSNSSRSSLSFSGEYFLAPTKSLQFGWSSELFSINYVGSGTRPTPATQVTQNRNLFMFGLNYYY
jgi:hypothetical protein